MEVTVVVPTYDEAENLPVLAKQLFALSIDGLKLLVIDDSSPDGTGQLAESLAERYPGKLAVIHREGKLGLGTAYVRGFLYALEKGSDFIVQMDADLSHSPAYIPAMLDKLEGADVVIGSRYIRGGGVDPNWSFQRKLLSWWGSYYSRAVLGLGVHDATGGFKCFRASVLRNLGLERITSTGFAFQVEMNYMCHKRGYKMVEIPIAFNDRTMGKSKMSLNIAFEAAWRVWQIKWRY